MSHLFVIGASHKSAPLEYLEALNKTLGSRAREALEKINAGLNGTVLELCLMATCNRYEIYGVGEKKFAEAMKDTILKRLHDIGNNSELLYLKEGEDALRHLFCVASGLDSMVIGESEILGQVKHSYEESRSAGFTRAALNVLFQRSLNVGKRVRTQTAISQGRLSVATVAFELTGKIFADFNNLTIVVVGAGAMGVETAKNLILAQPKNKIFVSRTLGSAQTLAQEFGGRAASLEELPRILRFADVVITHINCETPVIDRPTIEAAMERRARHMFIVDIGLPRNVAEDARLVPRIFLYNLSDLKSIAQANYEKRKAEVEKARQLINEEVVQFLPHYQERLMRVHREPLELGLEALA